MQHPNETACSAACLVARFVHCGLRAPACGCIQLWSIHYVIVAPRTQLTPTHNNWRLQLNPAQFKWAFTFTLTLCINTVHGPVLVFKESNNRRCLPTLVIAAMFLMHF